MFAQGGDAGDGGGRGALAHCPETAVLVLTAHDVDGYLADMAEAGAAGFVTKDQACPRLVEAIRRSAYGETLYT